MKRLLVATLAAASLLPASALHCAPTKPTSTDRAARQVDPDRLSAALDGLVQSGALVGVSALVFEDGREAYFGAFGQADREAQRPMARNTLVQIFSMTKPLTGVALMTLFEAGKFRLDDPVAKYAPEFANLRVYAGSDAKGEPVYEAPHRAVTIRDLMRHTAGLVGGGDDTTPVGALFRAADPMNPSNTLAEMAKRLGTVPLLYQPGTRWLYGPSVDVQAFLVERISGEPFDRFLRKHIFDPLRMNDTRYVLQAGDRDRLAAVYERSEDGALTRIPDERAYEFNGKDWPLKPGGWGLVSTLDDYMRFARMLLNDGQLDGTRILSAASVRLMRTNAMPAEVTDRSWLPTKGQVGFGIDFAVRIAPPASADESSGAVGEFFWDGAANTLFWVDPQNDIAAVLFTQYRPFGKVALHKVFRDAVYHGNKSASAPVPAAAASQKAYRNPVLFADYSDPDVIRVGSDYYLVASSFHFSPGIPVLKSQDLVHWSIVGHALATLDFDPKYDLPGPVGFTDAAQRVRFDAQMGHRYGAGVWAPAIRFHQGRFYVYFATPTEGVFMVSAQHAEGPWDVPVKVIAQAGLEDPCPFWDDDGNAYLVHSKVGAGPLILHRMSADGKSVLDAGKVIVEDRERLPVLEGPKFIKRNGFYYLFAPYGGVGEGPQAELRSKDIHGPYEARTVLAKGTTEVQAPHQGGYVETPSGEGWFMHFNSTGGYGRIVHLQPVRWQDDWPIMGELLPETTIGQPVASHAMPDVGRVFAPVYPQSSDEFSDGTLGLQWEWNHNPVDTHWSLTQRRGYLRLKALPATDLVSARNTLTQVHQGSASQTTARVDVTGMTDGQKAGLGMLQLQPSWIGVTQTDGQRYLTYASAGVETRGPAVTGTSLQLQTTVGDQIIRHSYSLDEGKTFVPFGGEAQLRFSWWKGSRPALFTFSTAAPPSAGGYVDIDWMHVRQLSPARS